MNCLLEFSKMTFTIRFIFTFLTGIILRPLFTTFCSCFLISFSKKLTFFMLGTWYCIRCLMNFFLLITLFSHPLQFRAHLNCLPHFMNLSMLNIILDISQMHCLFVFRKMFFLIHFDCSPLADIIFYSLIDEITFVR